MDEPYWLEDFIAAGGKVNRDGTIDLYHGTTSENATRMVQTQRMETAKGATAAYGVYLSSSPNIGKSGDERAGGYGDGTVVKVTVRLTDPLELDDQFPDGRMDFTIQAKTYRPVRISRVDKQESFGVGFRDWLVLNDV